jgi:hypothetical protein
VLCAGAGAVLGAGADAELGALAVQLEELPGVARDAAASEPLLPNKKVVTCIRWQGMKQMQVL